MICLQGFCVLSKWGVGAWMGGVQQWPPPPPTLLLRCQASSAVPGCWSLLSPGTLDSSFTTTQCDFQVICHFSLFLIVMHYLHILSYLFAKTTFWNSKMQQINTYVTFQVCQIVSMPAHHFPVGSSMTTLHLCSDGTYLYWVWSPASLNEKTQKGHSVFMDVFHLSVSTRTASVIVVLAGFNLFVLDFDF